MKNRPRLLNLALVFAMLFGTIGFLPRTVEAAGIIRISQVYGGGGNSEATLTNDFIELFNAGDAAVDISGWSVQYASSTGTSWQVTPLSGSIPAGGYYLVQEAQGTGGTTPLPTPDATGTIAMSATNGKVALVDSTTALSGTCPAGVVDFVGFGSADCYEGSTATPALNNTTAAMRNSGGCDDTDDNSADFSTATPAPRNSASPTNICGPVTITEPVINEFVFNHAGTDTNEYIEVYGDPETDYSNYSILQIEGDSSGGVITTIDTIGTTDANGFWWTGFYGDRYQNGTQTLLLVKDFTGLPSDDLDTDDDGAIDYSPWSAIVDAVAVNDGGADDITYGTPVLTVAYDGFDYAPGGASRIPNGHDTDAVTDWMRNDFDLAGIPGYEGTPVVGEAYNTPGETNILVTESVDLVINEIDYDQISTDTAEFIEVKNNGTSPVDLDGYWIELVNGSTEATYDTIDLPAVTLASGDYYVICSDATTVPNCDLEEVSSIQNGSPDAVALFFEATLVDTVSYAGDTVSPYTEGSGVGLVDDSSVIGSIQRCPDGIDTDQNNVDFVFAEPPTPGLENSCTSELPEVVINEIMQNPDAVSDTSGEWLELYNPTETSIDINGWTLADNGADNHLIDHGSPLEIPAGGYLILGNNSDQATNGGVVVDYSYGSNWFLSNSDDEVVLIDAASNEIDRVEYDGGPIFPDPTGASMSLSDPALDNNDGANWCTSITEFGDGDLGTPGAANICTAPVTEVLINEVDADTPGTDVAEFVELFDGGAGNTSLDGLVVVFFNGNGDISYAAYDLDGFSTDENGYFLLGNEGVVPTPSIIFPSNGIQNGPDAVALYEGDASGFPNGTAVTTANLLDAIVYDTDEADDTGLLVLLNAGQPQVNESAGNGSPVDSNQRCPNGSGGLRNTDTYTQFIPTPGMENCVLPPEACGDEYTPIYDIQGSGFSTPLSGTNLATEGIVVGDFQVGGKNGFFIQDMTGDSDPTTSDGIFVYAPGAMDVSIGDHVRVRGTATEYYDLTQVGSVSQVWLCEAGVTLPEATELALPVESADDFEQLEGMYVTIPQDLVIAEYFNFDRYGEIMLATERFMTFTAANEPDVAGFTASEEEYFLSTITLDDGSSYQNPDPAIHPNGEEFTLENLFRGGDLVANVTGVIDYSYDLYRIQPTQGADYTPVNDRPVTLDLEEGSLKVASFNVLNYFITIDNDPDDTGDDPSDLCGPSGGMDCRGADTIEEFERQKAKIIDAMTKIDADVFGLMEIENDSTLGAGDAVADLVAGLNAIAGAGTYDYISTGAIGTDAIKVALLYKPASVTPVGEYAVLDSTVDPRFIDTKNRPTLAQVFEDNLTGETFTVVVNHLKSKGSDCVDLGDPDLGDGAGNCNLTRLAAAEAMVDWLADETIFSEVDNVLIIGDLNSYDKEAPIDAIKLGADDTTATDDDYFDMIHEILGEDAYGYVFDGKIGYLDYALASTSLMDNILDVAIWHINADEPDLIDYEMTFKQDAQDALYADDMYRSSDHDPVIVSLRLNEGPTAVYDIYETDQDVTLNVPAPGVMANDSDPNPNDALWVDVRTEPLHGDLTLNEDGSFTYVPDPGFFGVDTFEYYLLALPPEMRSDYMDIGLVTITVNPKYQFFVPLVVND